MRSRSYLLDRSARVGLTLLASVLAIPAIAAFFTDHAERSLWENRPLAEFPSFAANDDAKPFFAGVDRFLNDHFGFALALNRLYRRTVFYGFRDSPARDLTRGDDGFLFLSRRPGIPAPFSAFQALCIDSTDAATIEKEWPRWITALQRFRQEGYRIGVAIAPSKQVVYPEKLPESVPARYRSACAAYAGVPSMSRKLVEEGAKRGINVTYPLEEFRDLRYDGNFYPREQFHVFDYAGHTLALALLRGFRIEPPKSYFAYRDAVVESRDLIRFLSFPLRMSARVYDYAGSRMKRVAQEPPFVSEYYARARQWGTITSNRPMTRRTALVIANSYGKPTAKHIAPAYRSLVWINVNDLQPEERDRFFAELVPRIAPDDLIFVLHDTIAASFHQTFPKPQRPPAAPPPAAAGAR